METATITRERVLAAASKCSTAKATLEILFPEFFQEDKYFNLISNSVNKQSLSVYRDDTGLVSIHVGRGISPHNLQDKTFLLSSQCNWEIRKEGNRTWLVPTKR